MILVNISSGTTVLFLIFKMNLDLTFVNPCIVIQL